MSQFGLLQQQQMEMYKTNFDPSGGWLCNISEMHVAFELPLSCEGLSHHPVQHHCTKHRTSHSTLYDVM